MSTGHVLRPRHSNAFPISQSSEEGWTFCRGTSSNVAVVRNWDFNLFVFLSLDRPHMRNEFPLPTGRVILRHSVVIGNCQGLLGRKYFDSEFEISSTEDSLILALVCPTGFQDGAYGSVPVQVQVHEFSISGDTFGCHRKQWATLNLERQLGTLQAMSTVIRLCDPYVFIFTRGYERPVILLNWRTGIFWCFVLRCAQLEFPENKIDIGAATFHPLRESILIEDTSFTLFPFGRPKSLLQLDIPSTLALAESGLTEIVQEVHLTKLVDFTPSFGVQECEMVHHMPIHFTGISSWSLNYLYMPSPSSFTDGSLSDSAPQPVLLSLSFTEDETEPTVSSVHIQLPNNPSHRDHHFLAPSRFYSVHTTPSATYSQFLLHAASEDLSSTRWVELQSPPEEPDLYEWSQIGRREERSKKYHPSLSFNPSHGRLLEIFDGYLFVAQY
ncbi:hypothetical protein SISNIDRAFT_299257 [Sistotremastrum niveocremeum HHB9708]|uniref:Uncharacterized protein n=1 Tax=Sistotremastrum niveocremeum HHB9708 TaxID=1314777 RepID=A0A164NER0_9AGAM|nr:hypothetical protein SISNIDRAFT_299257 [Sistotremastrum niveocremeum HHB9708]